LELLERRPTSAKIFFSLNSSFFTLVSAETDSEIKKFTLFLYFVICSDHFGIDFFFVNYHDLEKNPRNFFWISSNLEELSRLGTRYASSEKVI
jgi:hypothetical protein